LTKSSLSDIIAGCRQGREAARKAFYERFYGYALSVCLAYADSREDACEMMNDGFLKVFRQLKDLRDEAALLPWLRRIMVNTAIDYHRKSLKKGVTVSAEAVAGRLREPYLNDEAVFAQFSAEHILAILHRLPVPYRVVFSLYVLEGYPHAEIAARLNLAESTSRSHLAEANRLLRQALSAPKDEDYART
jgi:RNA polymerase sigma-70 factor (ECF subfamily)